MKKKLMCSILVGALFSASCISIFAQDAPSSNSLQNDNGKLSNAVVLYVGSPNTIVKSKMTKVDSTNDDVKPVIIEDRTLVPVRFISESFGADVKYDDITQTITAVLNSTTIVLTIDQKVIYVNGQAQTLDVAAQIINDRTFIPLRAMVNAIGKKVFWDSKGIIVISDTDNLLDSTTDKDLIDNVISQLNQTSPQGQMAPQAKNIPGDMPGLMGKVVSVSGNTITTEAGSPMGGVAPQGQTAQTQATTTTITIPGGMTIKQETKPGDTNPTDISISDIKAGMLLLVWYTDDTKQTISKIRVAQVMNGAPGDAQGGSQSGAQGGMSSADLSSITNKWVDVPYANVSTSEKLDILLPSSGSGPFPVVVAIHGGAFMMGDKAMCESGAMLEALNNGYALVSVNYRLSGEAIFPAAINDVKAAIRFIRANASKYNLNGDKIAVWGSSAGGNLAALVGTSADVNEFTDLSLGNANQSDSVQAVVDWFGPIEFDQMDVQFKNSGIGAADHSQADSPESKYLGNALANVPELVKATNPKTYISANTPPFYIEHGTKDGNVPTEQSVNFATALKSVIGDTKVTLTLLDGAGHGGSQFEATENVNKVFAFLDKYLK